MSYTPTIWANGKAPALNADNLNKIENELVKLGNDVSTIEGELSSLAEKTDITSTTSTTMPNSYSGRLKVDEIVGECQQFTTTGKNLLDCSGLTEQTKNGITLTPVYENGMLQYINVNGTSTARTDFTIGENSNITERVIIVNGVNGGTNSTYSMFMSLVGNTTTYESVYNTEKTITIADDVTYYNVKIRVNEGQTVSNVKFYPMIRPASITDATYEPYTNGASPNPSYPQEIKGVKGYNLLKNVATTKTVNGVTFTMNSDGSVTLNGTATSNGDYYLTTGMWGNTDNILGATGRFILTGTGTKDLHVYAGYGSGTVCSLSGGNIEAPFDAPDGVSFVFLRIISGVTYSNFTYYPMIRKASIADSTYVPYGMWGVKVIGSNWLDISKIDTVGTESCTIEENGKKITVSSKLPWSSTRFDILHLKGKSFYLVGDNITASGTYTIDVNYKHNGKGFYQLVNGSVITLPKDDVEYANVRIVANNTGNTLDTAVSVSVENLRIVELPDTPWHPYTESTIALSTELYGIGDVKDVIEGGKVKRKCRHFKLASNLINTAENYAGTNATRFAISLSDIASNGIANSVMCNVAQSVSSGASANTCRLYSSGQVFLFLDADSFPDKASLISYLESNDIYFVYELAEEITEDLPIADQIALNSIKTYDGITYLEFDSEIEPTFKGEYGTSKVGGYTLEGMLASRNGELLAQSNANRITALEATVVNNI